MDEVYHIPRRRPSYTPSREKSLDDSLNRFKRGPERTVEDENSFEHFDKRDPAFGKKRDPAFSKPVEQYASGEGGKRDPSHAAGLLDHSDQDTEFILKAYDIEDEAIEETINKLLAE